MNADNRRVLEALQMQPLTEEEKSARHILGRLYGPIATCKDKTRNGRLYNKELWEKALDDEVFKEKVANKSLFLELGHPSGREETDMEKVCACIPEVPKIVNGDLYAYVDILDLPNGRILKTLCDYGFRPGISSRGSGDVMPDDEVDPETFYLETWDIVQLPAVKKARLQMSESLDQGKQKLQRALCESYKQEKPEDKEIVKETANNAGLGDAEGMIKDAIDECDKPLEEASAAYPNGTPKDVGEIPWAQDEEEGEEKPILTEKTEEEEPEQEETEEEAPEEGAEASDIATVGEAVSRLSEFDQDATFEIAPIEIDGRTYDVPGITLDSPEEGKVVATIDCQPREAADNTTVDAPEADETEGGEAEDAEEEEAEAPEGSEAPVADGEGGEQLESVKDLIRENAELKKSLRDAKSAKAVSDAEVESLKESLASYKEGFSEMCSAASKAASFSRENASLREQLQAKNATIERIKAQQKANLTESADAQKAQLEKAKKALSEAIKVADDESSALKAQLKEAKAKLQKATALAEAYKKKLADAIDGYVANKAKMLGVRKADITSRLDEGYTLAQVDKVCDDLLESGRPAFGLYGSKATMDVRESLDPAVKKNDYSDPDNGYEIDDSLLILAGLKK